MRIIADLHLHSKYSRATSERMNISEITRFAPVKGLNLVGTGDFTHPQWLRELRQNLEEDNGTELYKLPKPSDSSLRFMTTCEVSTTFTFDGQTKKIHHVILTPTIENAIQINDRLSRYGDLSVDGRPTLNMSAAALVEEIIKASSRNVVIPAHVWTPWFSLFGDFSGFDRIEDCYQDTTKHIFAIETGLSSDPPMNWRLSALDRFTLVSNSDAHSSWPWRIGREANVLELPELTFDEVIAAIRSKDPQRFPFTIETYPDYGKYHWTGHRACNVSLSPSEAKKFGDICPVCRKKLTKGVEQRIYELADRLVDFKPSSVPGFKRLLPLSEVIQARLGVSSLYARKVWKVYNDLTTRFGNEYNVLIDAPLAEIAQVVDADIAEAIVKVRNEKVQVIPGYDGVYGEINIPNNLEEKDVKNEMAMTPTAKADQKRLADFF